MTIAPVAEPPSIDDGPTPISRRRRRPRAAFLAISVLGGVALVPSVLPFSPESSAGDRVCVPVVDGWHADREAPSQADFDELAALMQNVPSPEELLDPAVRAAWADAVKAQSSSPTARRVNSYINWSAGAGACVPESRHRLIQSGFALGGIAGVATVGMRTRRRRPLDG